MKTLHVVELRYQAVIWAEDGQHEHDALALAQEIALNGDPDSVEVVSRAELAKFNPDLLPYSVAPCYRTIDEIQTRQRLPFSGEAA